MAEDINISVDVTLTPIVVSDRHGTKVGAAFINLDDVRIPARITEIIEFAKTVDIENCEYEVLHNFSEMMEDKFCKLFGYDCRRSLFGILSPVTSCGGKYFYIMVIDQIMNSISAEIKANAWGKKISQYTHANK